MARKRKRCGWTRDGVKVREKKKGSGTAARGAEADPQSGSSSAATTARSSAVRTFTDDASAGNRWVEQARERREETPP
jgi:hypothetical protein